MALVKIASGALPATVLKLTLVDLYVKYVRPIVSKAFSLFVEILSAIDDCANATCPSDSKCIDGLRNYTCSPWTTSSMLCVFPS
jgi:hypothetical protein